jgi:hypothetical protein
LLLLIVVLPTVLIHPPIVLLLLLVLLIVLAATSTPTWASLVASIATVAALVGLLWVASLLLLARLPVAVVASSVAPACGGGSVP